MWCAGTWPNGITLQAKVSIHQLANMLLSMMAPLNHACTLLCALG